MSIQSEITRISGNVSDALDAIEAKGVTIPAGSNSDDLADLIAQIQQGGGSGIVVEETTDTSGGICKNIVAVDLSSDTVDAAHLLSGYTAHDRLGGAVTGSYVAPTYSSQAKTNISPTTSSQTIQPDEGYDGLSSVQINAMPSGSATAASSITATGATVSTGTNTLTLSKTVSNTPQVTAGYVASGTAGNSSVSLTASVTTQAAQTLYPSTSDQTISSGRYLTGTQTVKAVAVSNTLSADNVKSGVTITIGDSSDADRIMSVTGTYSGGGSSKAFQIDNTNHRISTTTYTDTGAYLKVAKAGKYDIYWSAFRSSTSSGTNGTQWYKNDVAQGSAYTSWSNSYCQNPHISGVTLALNDEIKIYARSSSNSRYVCVENLMIIEVD